MGRRAARSALTDAAAAADAKNKKEAARGGRGPVGGDEEQRAAFIDALLGWRKRRTSQLMSPLHVNFPHKNRMNLFNIFPIFPVTI